MIFNSQEVADMLLSRMKAEFEIFDFQIVFL